MSYVDIHEDYRQSIEYQQDLAEYAKQMGHRQCESCENWYDSPKDFTDKDGNEHDTCFMCCAEWQKEEQTAGEDNRLAT